MSGAEQAAEAAPLADYQHYPLAMRHPAFAPAIPSGEPRWMVNPSTGERRLESGQGAPARFPPVLVHSADDEEYYRAQGYEPAGRVSAEQFQRMNAVAVYSEPADFQRYPMYVGVTLCNDAAEEAAARAAQGMPAMPGAPASGTIAVAAEQAETAPAGLIERQIASLRENRASMIDRLADAKRQVEQASALAAQLETAIAGVDEQIARLKHPQPPALHPDSRRRARTPAAAPAKPAPAPAAKPRAGSGAKAWATRRARQAERDAAAQQEQAPS